MNLSAADLTNIESAIMMAVRVTEEMIGDEEQFNTVERAMMETQNEQWEDLLKRVREYGKG